VGADLSAKRPVHPTQMQWLKYCIRGQVRSHQVCCATALRRRRGGASHKFMTTYLQRAKHFLRQSCRRSGRVGADAFFLFGDHLEQAI